MPDDPSELRVGDFAWAQENFLCVNKGDLVRITKVDEKWVTFVPVLHAYAYKDGYYNLHQFKHKPKRIVLDAATS